MNKNFAFVGAARIKIQDTGCYNFLRQRNDEFESDFRHFVVDFIKESGIGCVLTQDDKKIVLTSAESDQLRLANSVSDASADSKRKYIRTLMGADSSGSKSSGYGLWFSGYNPKPNKRSDCDEAKVLLKSLLTDSEQPELRQRYLTEIAELKAASDENTRKSVWTRLWKKICVESDSLGTPDEFIEAMKTLRASGDTRSCLRPDDRSYCTSLHHMVMSMCSSWYENYNLRLNERNELRQSVAFYRKKHEAMLEQMSAFVKALKGIGYGLYRFKNLKESVSKVRFGQRSRHQFLDAELTTGNYPLLLAASHKDLRACFNCCLNEAKLQNTSDYISAPIFKRSYPIPFGLTGRGEKFELTSDGKRLKVKIDGYPEMVCFASHYLCNISVEPFSNGKGYHVKFQHRLKNVRRRGGRQWNVGEETLSKVYEVEVKEISIHKRGEDFYLVLPFTLVHANSNHEIGMFFDSADVEKTNKRLPDMPDSIISAAVDLGVTNPITIVHGKVYKGQATGELSSLGYGHGELSGPSIYLCDPSYLRKRLLFLARLYDDLMDAMRECKVCKTQNKDVSPETKQWISKKSGRPATDDIGKNRFHCEVIMRRLGKLFKRLRERLRRKGDNDLVGCMALIMAWKKKNSQNSCYQDINRTEPRTGRKVDESFVNFRKSVSRKIAARIVQYCVKHNVNVCFMERLNMVTSLEQTSSANALMTLFAPGQLTTAIKNALQKAGIGCCEVDPRGTSREDCVTGFAGYRPGKRDPKEHRVVLGKLHSWLFIEREGVLGRIESDKAAAINILKTGLNHSVFQPTFFVGKDGKATFVVSEGEKQVEKKRVIRCLAELGIKSHKFYDTGSKVVTSDKDHDPKYRLLKNEMVCWDASGFCTLEQRLARENRLRLKVINLLPKVEKSVPIFSLRPSCVERCYDSSHKPMLDGIVTQAGKEVTKKSSSRKSKSVSTAKGSVKTLHSKPKRTKS